MTSNRPVRPLYPVLLQSSQPRPWRTVTPAASSGEKPRSVRTRGATFWGTPHLRQIFRTSRWATIRTTESAMRKGSTFMLSRRWTVEAASLVWTVEKTRWPVRAALMAVSTVSWSRISPTSMMSGSWRRKARRAVAKFRLISSRMLTWLIPGM